MKGKAQKNERGSTVNFTPEEKKEYAKAAKEAGMSLGELIRMLLKGYVDGKRILQ